MGTHLTPGADDFWESRNSQIYVDKSGFNPAALKDWHDSVLFVGINYDKMTKRHQCLIETLVMQ